MVGVAASPTRAGLTRRDLFPLMAGGALSLASTAAASRSVEADPSVPPNVLFIVVDDLNDWVGALGTYPGVRTPNIDRLAAKGVLFTNAYATAPACNPSRCSVLTSIAPSTSSIYGQGDHLRDFLPDASLLPEVFRRGGYDTLAGGKIFHGSFRYLPKDIGTPGGPPGPVEYWSFDRDPGSIWTTYHDFVADPPPVTYPANGMDTGVFDWGAYGDSDEDRTPDGELALWASRVLESQRIRPFFLAVGFYRPHLPWYVPRAYFDVYPLEKVVLPLVPADDLDDVPAVGRALADGQGRHTQIVAHDQWRQAVLAYLASITFVDRQVGRVLDALERGPHAANTIVVLWSDHGYHLGEKLHWTKFTLWDRALHVPLIYAGPSIATGPHCARTVSLLDIFPTLLDLCGLPKEPGAEGHVLTPLLAEPDAAWPHPALSTWEQGNHSARSERYRYIRYWDGTEELYDHANDPGEFVNLAGQGYGPEQRALLTSVDGMIQTESEWLTRLNRFVAPKLGFRI